MPRCLNCRHCPSLARLHELAANPWPEEGVRCGALQLLQRVTTEEHHEPVYGMARGLQAIGMTRGRWTYKVDNFHGDHCPHWSNPMGVARSSGRPGDIVPVDLGYSFAAGQALDAAADQRLAGPGNERERQAFLDRLNQAVRQFKNQVASPGTLEAVRAAIQRVLPSDAQIRVQEENGIIKMDLHLRELPTPPRRKYKTRYERPWVI